MKKTENCNNFLDNTTPTWSLVDRLVIYTQDSNDASPLLKNFIEDETTKLTSFLCGTQNKTCADKYKEYSRISLCMFLRTNIQEEYIHQDGRKLLKDGKKSKVTEVNIERVKTVSYIQKSSLRDSLKRD